MSDLSPTQRRSSFSRRWWPVPRRWWPSRVAAPDPLGAALLDHFRTGRARSVAATRADGVRFSIETDEYFSLEGELAELDRVALEACRGRVLDVGAGAGRHALALEEQGLEVVSIDVSPFCVELCQRRGVRDARLFDIMKLDSDSMLGRFDTLLFGMQTIGVAGGVATLERLLKRIESCLSPGAQILVDSSALREPWEGVSDGSPESGEIVLSMRYRGMRGEPFPWLYLSEPHLREVAARAGYTAERLAAVDSGEYLLALSLSPSLRCAEAIP